MAKIMWVVCPKCEKKFYVSTDDFHGKERPMMCPFCQERFTEKGAKEVLNQGN